MDRERERVREREREREGERDEDEDGIAQMKKGAKRCEFEKKLKKVYDRKCCERILYLEFELFPNMISSILAHTKGRKRKIVRPHSKSDAR